MSKTTHKINVVENSQLQVEGNLHIGNNITYTINKCKIEIPYRLTNNIPSNADHILGRDTELTTITNYLAQNKPTVLVNGIGGIGKTSVATKYISTYGNQYKHLAWLTVQSSVAEAFTNDLVLLKSLHIEQDVRQLIETQRLTDAFKLVVHKLNTLEHTLVVLDNANNPDDLITHKNLFDTAKCHYLITSRTQPQEWTIVEIDHLPPDEAVNLFRKIAPSVSATDEDLKNLLSKLFFHTLLIELVAKAVENAGFSFAELQTMIENKFIHDEQLNEDIVSTGKHGDSVTDNRKRAKIEEYIWLIFSNVKDLGDDAKQILRGMALLPVATPFDRAFLKEHLALFEVKDIIPNLSLLVERGWLEKEQNKWFKMHPLIADVVVKHLNVDIEFADDYILVVSNSFAYDNSNPNHNFTDKANIKFLVDRLSDLFFHENTESISVFLNHIAGFEEILGNYTKAIKYAKKALEVAESIFPANHIRVGIRQNNLGLIYQNAEMYELASALLEKSLKNCEKNFGKKNPEYAIRLSNLAIVYHKQGFNDEAISLLESALKINISNYGYYHTQVAVNYSNLGVIYITVNQNIKAITYLESALNIDSDFFEAKSINLAKHKNNLADAYHKVGRKSDAKRLWQSAYDTFYEILGENQTNTFNLKGKMANPHHYIL